MIFRDNQLMGLPVETKSGTVLGKVSGIEIDSETQSILRYQVKQVGLIAGLKQPLIVHRSQVVSITKEKVLVEDSVATAIAAQERAIPLVQKSKAPSLPREMV